MISTQDIFAGPCIYPAFPIDPAHTCLDISHKVQASPYMTPLFAPA